nr:thioesterase family protein [Catenuloplanes atrovinosus]
MDAYGHVNNTRFLTLYEEARVALIHALARERGGPSLVDEGTVIARHEIDYLRPVVYRSDAEAVPPPPVVRIELWIENLRGAQFTVVYELFDGERLASRARTVCVTYDLAAGRPRRLTAMETEFLGRYAAAAVVPS